MGWEKFHITPGIFSSSRSMAPINSSLFWWKAGRHFSLGSRSTKYSVLKKPVVSVPSSGRPTWLTTSVTSGNAARMTRALSIVATPAVGPVLGASVPRTQMAPSSRWGRNSEPITPLKPEKTRQNQRAHSDTDGDVTMFDGPGRGMAIAIRDPAHHRVVPFARAFAEKETRQHRRDQHGKDQGAQQGKRHRPGHGLEQSALHRLQSKDRQIGGDDDADGVKDRALHFVSGLANLLAGAGAIGAPAAEMADDVLHHDHRAVDHHAEIKRAQRQQVGRDMTQIKTDGGKQQRERNGERNDQRAANIPQEEKENDHHQDDALGQIVQNRVGGVMQQIAAIQEGNDLDSLGQNLIIELFDLGVNAHQGRIGVVALLQQYDALDHIAVVDDLAVDRDEWPCRSGPGESSAPARPWRYP